ncbi:hypothetical protein CBR_g20996 [Chara braunii]|uniref:Uncharacterized protein n=1 Tax=Chara braunii TaxID=69332 RepID=A0A388L0B3_CHABU|nr:hypothetical protein CBR_g20996 [Chara braunii]|eukprot:GBG75750.1 hypothetical protein CBR_g20996 [Chara braunii]
MSVTPLNPLRGPGCGLGGSRPGEAERKLLSSCDVQGSGSASGPEETFQLLPGNNGSTTAFAMTIRLTPELHCLLANAHERGIVACMKFGSSPQEGHVIKIGEDEFKFNSAPERDGLCDSYVQQRSGEDGNGILVEAGPVRRKLHVIRNLNATEKDRLKQRSVQAEQQQKARKAIVLEHEFGTRGPPGAPGSKSGRDPPAKKRKMLMAIPASAGGDSTTTTSTAGRQKSAVLASSGQDHANALRGSSTFGMENHPQGARGAPGRGATGGSSWNKDNLNPNTGGGRGNGGRTNGFAGGPGLGSSSMMMLPPRPRSGPMDSSAPPTGPNSAAANGVLQAAAINASSGSGGLFGRGHGLSQQHDVDHRPSASTGEASGSGGPRNAGTAAGNRSPILAAPSGVPQIGGNSGSGVLPQGSAGPSDNPPGCNPSSVSVAPTGALIDEEVPKQVGVNIVDLRHHLIAVLTKESTGMTVKALIQAMRKLMPESPPVDGKDIERVIKSIAEFRAPGRYHLKKGLTLCAAPPSNPAATAPAGAVSAQKGVGVAHNQNDGCTQNASFSVGMGRTDAGAEGSGAVTTLGPSGGPAAASDSTGGPKEDNCGTRGSGNKEHGVERGGESLGLNGPHDDVGRAHGNWGLRSEAENYRQGECRDDARPHLRGKEGFGAHGLRDQWMGREEQQERDDEGGEEEVDIGGADDERGPENGGCLLDRGLAADGCGVVSEDGFQNHDPGDQTTTTNGDGSHREDEDASSEDSSGSESSSGSDSSPGSDSDSSSSGSASSSDSSSDTDSESSGNESEDEVDRVPGPKTGESRLSTELGKEGYQDDPDILRDMDVEVIDINNDSTDPPHSWHESDKVDNDRRMEEEEDHQGSTEDDIRMKEQMGRVDNHSGRLAGKPGMPGSGVGLQLEGKQEEGEISEGEFNEEDAVVNVVDESDSEREDMHRRKMEDQKEAQRKEAEELKSRQEEERCRKEREIERQQAEARQRPVTTHEACPNSDEAYALVSHASVVAYE